MYINIVSFIKINRILSYLVLILVKCNYTYSKNIYFETNNIGAYVTSKTIKMANGKSVIQFENDMAWTDNFGNYGSAFCYGFFISTKKIYSKFDLYCEAKNQKGDYLWSYYTRPDTEYDAGSGEAIFIDGTGDYKKLVGTKCVFSTRYMDKKIFSKTKCKISDEQHKILNNMSK